MQPTQIKALLAIVLIAPLVASCGDSTVTQPTVPIPVVPKESGDFAIVDAQWTQGVQAADGSIPMVLNGSAAVVNVLLSSTIATNRSMQVVLRLFDANLTQYRADTVTATISSAVTPTLAQPSVQFLVQPADIRAGMSWQLMRDPRGAVPDTIAATDAFPRSGRATVATVSVPALKIRFVPIVLATHGSITGSVNAATIKSYTQTLRSVHPVGVIQTSIGAPFTTNASFGTAPSGGSSAFWQQVLSELDVARVTDPTATDQYWIGVVAPPTGFNFTEYGGFSYIPANATGTGPGTRTAVLVNIGWFSRPTQTRDLVAHELGHAFGRRHAPCANAGGPDPAFPTANGTIGRAGHDVYSWSEGLAVGAATVSADIGDVMGYCFPVWASEYTYRAVLAFRGTGIVTQVSESRLRSDVLIVRGHIDRGGVSLDSTLTVRDAAIPDQPAGTYVAEGVAADGRVLFQRSFTPLTYDHNDDVKPFTVLVPATDMLIQNLEQIRVRGPAGVTLRKFQSR